MLSSLLNAAKNTKEGKTSSNEPEIAVNPLPVTTDKTTADTVLSKELTFSNLADQYKQQPPPISRSLYVSPIAFYTQHHEEQRQRSKSEAASTNATSKPIDIPTKKRK